MPVVIAGTFGFSSALIAHVVFGAGLLHAAAIWAGSGPAVMMVMIGLHLLRDRTADGSDPALTRART